MYSEREWKDILQARKDASEYELYSADEKELKDIMNAYTDKEWDNIYEEAKITTMGLEEAAFEKSRVMLSPIQCNKKDDVVFIEGSPICGADIHGYAVQDIAFANKALGVDSPSKIGAGIDQFELANIQLTTYQKEAMIQLGQSFKGLTEAMAIIMSKTGKDINKLAEALIESVRQPEPSFAKRKKSWKRDRFYD